MKKIIIAWENNNSIEVLNEIKKDSNSIKDLLTYTNKINGWDKTMIQSWILQEIHLIKNNGYGIYELIKMLETKQQRVQCMIKERKNKIKELEKILQGKDIRYNKYNDEQIFINSVKKNLEIEKQLLNELLTDGFYK